MFLKIFYIYCLLIPTWVYAEDLKTLSFDQKEWISYHHSEVRIRGFLYQTKEGQWILASEPHLKSCCVGSHHKIDQQIIVLGMQSLRPPSQAVTIQGKFSVDPIYTEQGELRQLYMIEKAQVITEHHTPILTIAIVCLFLLLFCLFYLLKKT